MSSCRGAGCDTAHAYDVVGAGCGAHRLLKGNECFARSYVRLGTR